MTGRLVGTFDLLDRASRGFVEARLYSPADAANAADFEQRWRPDFDQRRAELKASGNLTLQALRENNMEDSHWLWAEKVDFSTDRLDRRSFAIVAEDVTQGLMLVTTVGFAREASQRGKPLVVVDFLATAPWNRKGFSNSARFKGVGRIMMIAAISLSVQEEFNGRLGLHSLPQTEQWYRDVVGMTDLGIDETNMRYFEMTEAQAKAFLT